MKLLIAFLLFAITVQGQQLSSTDQKLNTSAVKWRMDKNKYLTGGLIFVAGAAKGFNETLLHHWKIFRAKFPEANPNWYNPAISWRNKYEGGKPENGAKFPLSTTALVMFTDQYHLNNFINRGAITAALVIKIGEGKRPLGHYLKDILFYTIAYQAGWALTYMPFRYDPK